MYVRYIMVMVCTVCKYAACMYEYIDNDICIRICICICVGGIIIPLIFSSISVVSSLAGSFVSRS